jgi:hypothetical protein
LQSTITSYNIPVIVILEGELDRKKLEDTIRELIKRHEILRTSFEIVDGKAVQRIHDEVVFTLEYYEADETEAKEIAHRFIKPFDLGNHSVLRVGLIKTSNITITHILMVDMHHIITDGVSMDIFVDELMALYRGEELPELKLQYKDFSDWQNQWMASRELEEQKRYWLRQLKGEVPIINLPIDFDRPSKQSFEGSRVGFELGSKKTALLKKVAVEQNVTLSMLLIAAYNILLSRITNQEDIVIGIAASGRGHEYLQKMMGIFVNLLILRNYPGGEKTFRELLVEVKANILEAFENQDYPFEELAEQLIKKRDMSRHPLIDASFELIQPHFWQRDIPGLKIKPYRVEFLRSKIDLAVKVTDVEENLYIGFEYCSKLFKRETIDKMIRYFRNTLDAVIENPHLQISEIGIMSEEEKFQVINKIKSNNHASNTEDIYVNVNQECTSTREITADFDFLSLPG